METEWGAIPAATHTRNFLRRGPFLTSWHPMEKLRATLWRAALACLSLSSLSMLAQASETTRRQQHNHPNRARCLRSGPPTHKTLGLSFGGTRRARVKAPSVFQRLCSDECGDETIPHRPAVKTLCAPRGFLSKFLHIQPSIIFLRVPFQAPLDCGFDHEHPQRSGAVLDRTPISCLPPCPEETNLKL